MVGLRREIEPTTKAGVCALAKERLSANKIANPPRIFFTVAYSHYAYIRILSS